MSSRAVALMKENKSIKPRKIHVASRRFQMISPLLSLVGVSVFLVSFFLTKRILPDSVSPCSSDYLHNVLLRETLGLGEDEISILKERGMLASTLYNDKIGNYKSGKDNGDQELRNGCWLERRAAAVTLFIVDALRPDLAMKYFRRSLYNSSARSGNRSEVYKFIADPPTVTRQRLQGLTGGTLPTFGDVTNQFGRFEINDDGAILGDDNWVQQLVDVPLLKRMYGGKDSLRKELAFVGDDTWIDLFPTQFNYSFPYPSFNTRDLDTVDDGCFYHLPHLINHSSLFELSVIHTLGIDHVGHTFGAFSEEMKDKYDKTDVQIDKLLSKIDSITDKCDIAFIFGDHGQTDDGNHGGSSEAEITSAIWAHYSPGCKMNHLKEIRVEDEPQKVMNQIDLVSTISYLLGIPIPFSNLGTVAVDILPLPPSALAALDEKISSKGDLSGDVTKLLRIEHSVTALAINSAQVWNYFQKYSLVSPLFLSKQNNEKLTLMLNKATESFSTAIRNSIHDNGNEQNCFVEYERAYHRFSDFLSTATDVGRQAWSEFNIFGMFLGISIICLALAVSVVLWFYIYIPSFNSRVSPFPDCRKITECVAAAIFIMLQIVLLTFSNSYIDCEQSIVMFTIACLCILIFPRLRFADTQFGNMSVSNEPGKITLSPSWFPVSILVASRIHELFVFGHGLDPSLKLYSAQNPIVFVMSSFALMFIRLRLFADAHSKSKYGWSGAMLSFQCDVLAILFLCASWRYKRKGIDFDESGFVFARCAFLFPLLGYILERISWLLQSSLLKAYFRFSDVFDVEGAQTHVNIFRIVIILMNVTGPSSAISVVLVFMQVWPLYYLAELCGSRKVPSFVLSILWKSCIRQTFFATGHSCSLGELQLSSAFVATKTFYFIPAGLSLFLNSFGWDIIGWLLCLASAKATRRRDIWQWLGLFYFLELLFNTVSVSVMRRHLMMWATFAPHFIFTSVLFVTFVVTWSYGILNWPKPFFDVTCCCSPPGGYKQIPQPIT